MLTVSINEPELLSIELLRVALSEPEAELREKAITNAKHEVAALGLDALSKRLGTGWMSEPQNADFVQWIARSSSARHEASNEFSQTFQRYEEQYERKLNVAEHIGKLIWLSIQDEKFEGVYCRRPGLSSTDIASNSGLLHRDALSRPDLRKLDR